VKTDAGKREEPLNRHGVILAAIQGMCLRNTKFRKPDDLVFANKLFCSRKLPIVAKLPQFEINRARRRAEMTPPTPAKKSVERTSAVVA
jgi:hypothetical protein